VTQVLSSNNQLHTPNMGMDFLRCPYENMGRITPVTGAEYGRNLFLRLNYGRNDKFRPISLNLVGILTGVIVENYARKTLKHVDIFSGRNCSRITGVKVLGQII
jgi:hypothetical protein